MNRIAVYLNQHIIGVVYSAPSILSNYATDRSILRFYPRIVAEPINATDVRRIVKFSSQLATKNIPLPITVRGGGNRFRYGLNYFNVTHEPYSRN